MSITVKHFASFQQQPPEEYREQWLISLGCMRKDCQFLGTCKKPFGFMKLLPLRENSLLKSHLAAFIRSKPNLHFRLRLREGGIQRPPLKSRGLVTVKKFRKREPISGGWPTIEILMLAGGAGKCELSASKYAQRSPTHGRYDGSTQNRGCRISLRLLQRVRVLFLALHTLKS